MVALDEELRWVQCKSYYMDNRRQTMSKDSDSSRLTIFT